MALYQNLLHAWCRLKACNVITIALILMFSTICYAQQTSASTSSIREFFAGASGEWIGTCEQSTDGEKADNKYFHVVVKQTAPDIYNSRFEYYRYEHKSGVMSREGISTIVTTIQSDGSAVNNITGQGTILVNNKPKSQEHQLQETITFLGDGRMKGEGTGTIKICNLPLGLGKNGKIREDKSTWELENGKMTIHQTLKAGFRALFVNKSYNVEARYTAIRGTDVVTLIKKPSTTATSGNERS